MPAVTSVIIIEWLRLKGTSEIIQFQLPAVGRVATHQLGLHRTPSSLVLNASKDGAPHLPWAAVSRPHYIHHEDFLLCI